MKSVSIQDVAALREQTGVGMMAAKRALEDSGGNFEKAIEALRKAGQKVAASKAHRVTKEGLIGHYVHANGKVAALVAVSCETDFVARSDVFTSLVHDLALHVTAANPTYLQPDDVPAELIAKEREIYREQLASEKKPKAVREKIIEGKLEKYYEEHCLLRQKFVKDDTMTITGLIEGTIQKLGENIRIREFVRMSL